ncbi:unnamed protein product [Dibothriocephalus latus]|uniref:Uncharacterized protein n=1 Tax=Dibothriocephalus latus TaxID=60516 RepID=A0A3P7LTN9_DIBLA|nr:unnamed protein product [Dibothriocephalus latus]
MRFPRIHNDHYLASTNKHKEYNEKRIFGARHLLADVGLTDERTRMRRLIVGIICLLLLNLLLFFLFVTIGCYLRRRFRRRRKSSMACQIISASNASDLVRDQVNPGQSNVKEAANGTAVGSKNAHTASNGFHNYQPEFIFPPVSLPIRSKEEQQLLKNGNPTIPDGEVCLPSRPPAPRHSTLLQRLSLHVPWRRRGSTSRYKHTLVLEHPNDSLNVDWGIKNLHPL